MSDINNDKWAEQIARKILPDLCLFDNEFMIHFFKDADDCLELVLRIILAKEDLQINQVQVQTHMGELLNRSVYFDILA